MNTPSRGPSIEDLRGELRAVGARPLHETLMLRAWVRGLPLAQYGARPDSPFPKALRAALPALNARFAALTAVRSEHVGADGATRASRRW